MKVQKPRLLLTLEHRFLRTPDGQVWTRSAYPYSYFRGYFAPGLDVLVMARVSDVLHAPTDAARADGDRVTFVGLEDYVGLSGFLRTLRRNGPRAISTAKCSDAILLKTPAGISSFLGVFLLLTRRPFSVEVVGDPREVFAPGVLSHPLRRQIRAAMTLMQRLLCRRAASAIYVTSRYLQQRYPCSAKEIAASDVDLSPVWFEGRATRSFSAAQHLVAVGSLEQPYKGADILLRALRRCADAGVVLRLTWVGGGRTQPQMEALAASLGLSESVTFAGSVAPGRVRAILDSGDLFVLPSRTEGLPRAILEAQARGLPCIASRVGGVPEVVHEVGLFEPGAVEQLSTLLIRFANDEEFRGVLRNHTEAARSRLMPGGAAGVREAAILDVWRRARREPDEYIIGGSVRLCIDRSYAWSSQLKTLLADVLHPAALGDPTVSVVIRGAGAERQPSADLLIDRGYGVAIDPSTDAQLTLETKGPGIEWVMWSLQIALLKAQKSFVHAAALSRDGRVYLIAAPGGTGKTATISHLISDRQNGFMMLGDDLVVVSRAGACHAFPKAMALYHYHSGLPHVSEKAPAISSSFLEPFRGAKRHLRRWPAVLGHLRNANPFVRWQAPSASFGEEKLVRAGQLAGVIWLERSDVDRPTVRSNSNDFGEQLAAMTLQEFDSLVRQTWAEGARPGWLRDIDVPGASASIVAAAIHHVKTIRLLVPRELGSAAMAACVRSEIDIMDRAFEGVRATERALTDYARQALPCATP